MTTKEKLIELFEKNKGVYFSGEELGKRLSLSRTAVWKAVKSLQNDGYSIDAITNKGYCMSAHSDIVSVQGIKKYINDEYSQLNFLVLDEVGSTNSLVREKAVNSEKEGFAVVANKQTSGRGRVGRNFFSPGDTGVYMSLLLRPSDCSPQKAVRITTIAAVAMCEAIEAVSGKKAGIKWVNDIFVEGKKVCGILTEASIGLESRLIEYAVLGVGVNVYPPENGFPKEICLSAGTVFSCRCDDGKNRLVAEFFNCFMKYYCKFDSCDYAKEYKRRSLALGKKVNVILKEEIQSATVLDIDEDCRLLVKFESGVEKYLSSGEISIKL